MVDTDERAEFARGLRELADFIEAHPDRPVPPDIYAAVHISDTDELRAAVRAIGSADKEYSGDFFTAVRHFPGGIRYGVQAYREQVCERVVVGTETVEVPDPEALAAVPRVTQEREIVEWRCEPVLAGRPAA